MAFGNNIGSPSNSYVSQGDGDAILKEYYGDIENEMFDENPWLALIPKKEDVTGRNFVQDVIAGAGQGRSAIFSTAQNAAATTGELPYAFLVNKIENHAVANVSNQLIAESSSSKGAFLDAVRLIADDQLQNFTNDMAISVFRGADKSRGQVGGSVAGTTLTFSNAADATNFETGMWLDFATLNTGSSLTFASVSTQYCQITNLDYIGGTATVAFSSGTNTLTANGVAVGNYIYQSGDKSLGLNGFTDWIPYGALATNDSFLGVNRNANRARLAGSYLDGTGGNLEEVLENAIAQVSKLGGKLTHFLMSHAQYRELAQAQGAKVQLVDVVATPQIGFTGIQVVGHSSGPVVCLPDRSCPSNLIAGINRDTWKMISVGKAAHVWDEDGRVWLRSSTQAGMEIRFYSLANVVCTKPVHNINIRVNPLV